MQFLDKEGDRALQSKVLLLSFEQEEQEKATSHECAGTDHETSAQATSAIKKFEESKGVLLVCAPYVLKLTPTLGRRTGLNGPPIVCLGVRNLQ